MPDLRSSNHACKGSSGSDDKNRRSPDGPTCSLSSGSATTATTKRPEGEVLDKEDNHLRRESSRTQRGLGASTQPLTYRSASLKNELPSPPYFVGSGISKLSQPYWRRGKAQERGLPSFRRNWPPKLYQLLQKIPRPTKVSIWTFNDIRCPCPSSAVSKGEPDSQRSEASS